MRTSYNIGDKVKVRDDLIPGQEYGGITFYAGKMESTSGIEGIIDKIKNGSYRIKGYSFLYSAEMLTKVTRKKK